jgi:hypothetical protein
MIDLLTLKERTWDTKRIFLYCNHNRCDLVSATHDEKMHKLIILVVNKRFSAVILGQWDIQNPPIANHDELFMHFLAMSRSGQVATDGCNGQVLF